MKHFYLIFLAVFAGISTGLMAGNFNFPHNKDYPFGIRVASATASTDIQSIYTSWKSSFYEEGFIGGSISAARIKLIDAANGSPNGEKTWSEGIGYGMLIFVYMENATNNTQDEFDRLWRFYKNFENANGLMDWRVLGFTTVDQAGSATDGDLDVAMALLLADKQWGSAGSVNYVNEATTLLNAIYKADVSADSTLLPGDSFTTEKVKNPSYHHLAAFSLFSKAQEAYGFSVADTHPWDAVLKKAYTYLNIVQSEFGFYPSWTTYAGANPNSATRLYTYGMDACRTPWRVVWDYLWYGENASTPNSLTLTKKTATWVNDSASVPSSTGDSYNMAGKKLSSWNNAAFMGGFGASLMCDARYTNLLTAYYNSTRDFSTTDPFQKSVQLLYTLLMSGNCPDFFHEAPVVGRVSGTAMAVNGTAIGLSFSKDINTISKTDSIYFTLMVNGTNRKVSLVPNMQVKTMAVLTFTPAIKSSDVVTLSYSGTTILDADGLSIPKFTNLPIINTVPAAGFLLADCMDTLVATGGTWFSYNDGGSGGLSTITPMRTSAKRFTMTSPGYKGASDSCLKAEMTLDKGTFAYDPFVGVGFKLKNDSSAIGADWANAKSIEFYHKGAACLITTYMSNFMDGTKVSDNQWQHDVPAHADWTLVRVTFDNSSTGLHLPVWFSPAQLAAAPAIDPTKFFKIQWQVQSAVVGYKDSLFIDELKITGVQPKVRIIASSKVLCPGMSVDLKAKAIGSANPVTFKWNDGTTAALKTVTSIGKYSVTVYEETTGIELATASIQIDKPFAEQIRVVTKDPLNNDQTITVAWERSKGRGIKSYKLERMNIAQQFDSIAGLNYADMLFVADNMNNENGQYRLVTIDSACNTQSFSDTANSINLMGSVLQTGECVLSWKAYNEKQNSYYYIYGRDKSNITTLLDSIQATVDAINYSYTLNKSYGDIIENNLVFYVAYKLPKVIDVSSNFDSNTHSFEFAYSNLVEMPLIDFGITKKKAISDTSIVLGSLSAKYKFSDYFNYTNAGANFQIRSTTDVVNLCMTNDYFGFIAAKEGTTAITISAGGINQTFTVTVSAPSCGISVLSTITNNLCYGANTGAIQLNVSGGAAPYQFLWSNMRTDNKLSNLIAGHYSVIITDANSCKATKTFVVTEPKKLSLAIDSIKPTSNLANGSFALHVSGGVAPYKYQWNNAAWNKGDSISKASNVLASSYKVTITDQNSCKMLQTIALGSKTNLDVQIDELKGTNCHPNDGRITLVVSGGNGVKSFLWNDGVTTQNRDNLAAGEYSVTVTDEDGGMAIKTIKVQSFDFPLPEIALVTVKNNKNLVVWLKDSTSAIDFFTVYRENENSGLFNSVGVVKYDSVSVFEDKVANSVEQSWRYRLTATNFCGLESIMSSSKAEYKTINLKTSLKNGAVELDWDAYEGLFFLEYVVYRNSDNGTFSELARVPAGKTHYVDTKPTLKAKLGYRVEVAMPRSVNPLLFKTDSGPFSQSFSNMSEASLVSVPTVSSVDINVYPQPASDVLNVLLSDNNGAIISLFAANGSLVAQSTIVNGATQFDVARLASGLYVLEAQIKAGAITKSVSISK